MAKGRPGADSTILVTAKLVDTATKTIGQQPVFWGRYFKNKSRSKAPEYLHKKEDPVLAQFGIRLLPIAQQTAHVSGSEAQGQADAIDNVEDLLATFDQSLLVEQGGEFLMFLDVEGLPDEGNPSLSVDYFRGWGTTLVDHSRAQTGDAVTILPCVYARSLDNDTWNNLIAAGQQGVQCHGAWVARFRGGTCEMRDFDAKFALPSGLNGDLPFDVLIHQYEENCAKGVIDCDQTNPDIDDIDSALLSRLILPPTS
jgi:hypothetical protein